jgi:hypothetical protein
MSALFTNDDGVATDDNAEPSRPDVKTVRLLEGFGYRAEAVRLWTAEKAFTTLQACRKEQKIALARAERTAVEQEDSVPRGQPSQVERLAAAACIEQATTEGIDELHQCVCYSLYALRDDELKRLAGFVVRVMRGQA